jgi:voltage-gated sodium channel
LDVLVKQLAALLEKQHTVTFKLVELLQSNANGVPIAPVVFGGDEHQAPHDCTHIVNVTKPGCVGVNAASFLQTGPQVDDSVQTVPAAATQQQNRPQSSGLVHSSSGCDLPKNDDVPTGKQQNGHWNKLRILCDRVIQSPLFDPVVGIFIVMNAVCLGFTLDNELKGHHSPALAISEHIFLFLFTAELLLNVVAYGPAVVTQGWKLFDLVIILGGVVSQWMLGPFIQGPHPVVEVAEQVLILRMMRLLRLVRAVRLVTSFRALWKLTNSFLLCAPTMMSAFTLMITILYIFACIGAEFIAKGEWADPALAEHVRVHFSTLPRTLLSLIQFVTGDSISSIYFPLIVHKPVLCIYFVALIMMITLALMNLVTAALVDDSMSMTRMDDEMEAVYTRHRLRKLKPSILELFRQIDRDASGHVEQHEVIDALSSGLAVPTDLKSMLTEDRILDVFDSLDSDGDGVLSIDEFVEGLCYKILSDVPVETQHILLLQSRTMSQLCRMEKALHDALNLPCKE